MAMTFAELVQLGIKKESDTEAFYRYWAERLSDPGARTLLDELAQEEAKHRVFFENLEDLKKVVYVIETEGSKLLISNKRPGS